jgi:uncharacterized repeat protein (TIGR03803 family)
MPIMKSFIIRWFGKRRDIFLKKRNVCSSFLRPSFEQLEERDLPSGLTSFSNLSAPVVTYGTMSTTIAGQLTASAGATVPAGETVVITLNDVSQSASLDADGNFSTTFTTSALGVAGSPYAIGFVYAGDANFAGATTSSTLTVQQATPILTVSDAGGTYNGQPFPATARVAGVVTAGSNQDNTPASSLEGVTPTLAYFAGNTPTGTPLAGPPVDAGTYTVVATFPGSSDYSAVQSSSVFNLVTLVTFDGGYPNGGLLMDSNGNLFGTTSAAFSGTLFEWVKSSGTLVTLANTTFSAGNSPFISVQDSAGNLFGITFSGGADNDGTLCEWVKSSGQFVTLLSFDGSDGQGPQPGIIADSNGNLFGVTSYGGTYDDGTIFEWVKSSGTLVTLATFNGSDGAQPHGHLVEDSSGDFFGTTVAANPANGGTLFELTSGGTLLTLARFDAYTSLGSAWLEDSSGNLFGTIQSDLTDPYGALFEWVKSSGTVVTLAVFNNTNGANPDSGLIEDSSGNLFGTAEGGSDNPSGTVFEWIKANETLLTLASFDGSNGSVPEWGMVEDASGNLFDTTLYGGQYGDGTLFELANSFAIGKATPTVTVSDAGGAYTGSPQPATATVAGVVASGPNQDNTPAPSLEGVTPSLTYYSGSTATGTPLGGAPTLPGTYTVTASFPGSADYNSASATTTFTILVPADSVTLNPASTTVNAGQTATFTAASANPLGLDAVQWQVNQNDGNGFTDLSGARSTTLVISDTTAAQNGYEYRAIFDDAVYGVSLTTSAASLSVDYVTADPANTEVKTGATASFSAASLDPLATDHVQWQVNQNDGNGFTDLAGATSTTLTINDVTAAKHGYEYQAVFSNAAYPGSLTTSAAALTVDYVSFVNLSAPVVMYGTATTTLSGQLIYHAGTQSGGDGQTETVAITLDGVTLNGTADSDGNFSATFGTSTLGVADSPYTIGFDYLGDTDFGSATASSPLNVAPAIPILSITDVNGAYNGMPYPATATVFGVVASGPNQDNLPASSLEGVTPTVSYYAGKTARGTPLAGPPTQAGTYTVVASFPGSADYAAVQASSVDNVAILGSLQELPEGGLVEDPSGNLFGTTEYGGPDDDGTLFEWVASTGNIVTLATFDGTNGANPISDLVMDPSGNLIGTTFAGGANNLGTVFELAHNSTTIDTIASFNGFDGDGPGGTFAGPPGDGLLLDPNGNLFGVTEFGGPGFGSTGNYQTGYGTIFEVAHGTDSITTLVAFSGGNGTDPTGLIADANGNLFGTTFVAIGNNEYGTVFEWVKSTGTLVTLHAFNPVAINDGQGTTEGYLPVGNMVEDSSGNLFGTTTYGGVTDSGTIFELTSGGTFRTVASFSGLGGPEGDIGVPLNLFTDGDGNLFGRDDASGLVFELERGSNTVINLPLANASDLNGPVSALIEDGNGDFFGTTPGPTGTLFEIEKNLIIARATPTITVADVGGTYNGSPFPAIATVAGVVTSGSNQDNTLAPSLEGVTPTLTYYDGGTADGAPLPSAPSLPGTYTVVASFAGSTDYTAASAITTFTIAPATRTSAAFVSAMWVYNNEVTDPGARQNLVNQSIASNINTIYISVYQSTPNSAGRLMYDDADMTALIALAHANGIQVWADYGAPDWPSLGTLPTSFPMQRLADVVAYNAANPTAAFDGVMLDVEFAYDATNPASYDDQENAFLQQLLPLDEGALNVLRPAGLQVGATVSAFWNPNELTDAADQAAVTITFAPQGTAVTEPAYQQILDLGLDQVVVLGYRDFAGAVPPSEGQDGIIGLDQDEINYAVSTGSNTLVVAALETQDITPSDQTFYGDGNSAMNSVMQTVAGYFGNSLGGFAIDGYGDAYLSGQPSWPASSQITPTITWMNPAGMIYGTPLSSTQLDAAATTIVDGATISVPGTFTYSPAAGTVLNAGQDQMVSVTFTPSDSTDYATATDQVAVNVSLAPLTITPAAGQSMAYGSVALVLAYTFSGFANGDTASLLQGSLGTTASSNSLPGAYGFTLGTLTAGPNYRLALSQNPPLFAVTAVPAGTVNIDRPTFAWPAVAGATHYALTLTHGKTVVLSRTNLAATTYALTAAQALTPGLSYTWSVTPLNAKGKAVASRSSFAFQVLPVAVPTAVGPVGSITTSQPTFTWTFQESGHIAANHYTLKVTDTTTKHALTITNLTGVTYTLTAAQALTPGHSFTWSVTAVSTNGKATAAASPLQFAVAPLTAPTDLAFNSLSDSFSWQTVPDAGDYTLKVVNSRSGRIVVDIPDISGTTQKLTSKQLAALKPKTGYAWIVTAVSTNGKASASSEKENLTL